LRIGIDKKTWARRFMDVRGKMSRQSAFPRAPLA